MIDWYQDQWKHTVILKDGTKLFPSKIELSSASRDENGDAYPCLFCEFAEELQWISWDKIKEIKSENIGERRGQ